MGRGLRLSLQQTKQGLAHPLSERLAAEARVAQERHGPGWLLLLRARRVPEPDDLLLKAGHVGGIHRHLFLLVYIIELQD